MSPELVSTEQPDRLCLHPDCPAATCLHWEKNALVLYLLLVVDRERQVRDANALVARHRDATQHNLALAQKWQGEVETDLTAELAHSMLRIADWQKSSAEWRDKYYEALRNNAGERKPGPESGEIPNES